MQEPYGGMTLSDLLSCKEKVQREIEKLFEGDQPIPLLKYRNLKKIRDLIDSRIAKQQFIES